MPKTTEEKMKSAQETIRKLKPQLAAANKIIEARGKKILEFQAQGKAFNMWVAYFLHRFGEDGVLGINKDELYKFRGSREVVASYHEDTGEIVIRVPGKEDNNAEIH